MSCIGLRAPPTADTPPTSIPAPLVIPPSS
jgi:hypothetical protein